jgi:hypothetical protein
MLSPMLLLRLLLLRRLLLLLLLVLLLLLLLLLGPFIHLDHAQLLHLSHQVAMVLRGARQTTLA